MLVLVLAMALILKAWRPLRDEPGIVLLLIWCGLTIVWSARGLDNIEQFALLLATVATAAIIARAFGTKGQVHFMGRILTVGLLICVAFAILVPSVGLMRGGHDGDLRGLLFHKNHFGAFAAFASCYLFAVYKLALHRRYGALAFLAGALAFLAGICVLLSGSASAVLMLLAALGIAGMVTATHNTSRGKRKLLAWILLLLVPILGWYVHVFWAEILELLGRDTTLTHRTGIWAVVLDYLQEHPLVFFFGSGPGGATANAELIDRMQLLSGYRGVTTTHSAYLDIIINFGVIGLLAFVVINIAALATAFRIYTQATDRRHITCSILAVQIIVLGLLRNSVTSEAGLTASFPFLMFLSAVFLLTGLQKELPR
ncbi:MAG: O-antigen ligase family protein [Thiohalocapsa sp.]